MTPTTPATPMTPQPTGRREERDGASYVAYTRTFAAPIDDVWAAVTEPARLERWIGTWSGDPDSGSVAFRMTAEGEDAPVETYAIEICDPPRRLVLHSETEGEDLVWHLVLDLAEATGVTTLTFAQELSDPEVVASVGPGWEYYLDRLVAAEGGQEVASVSWEDYTGQADHFRALFA